MAAALILAASKRAPSRRSPADGNRRIVGAMSTLATDAAAVLVHEDEPAVHITLNRPDKRNALSLELMEELIDSLRRVSASPGVRVIVLEAAGPAFSAGHDLSEMIGRDVPSSSASSTCAPS